MSRQLEKIKSVFKRKEKIKTIERTTKPKRKIPKGLILNIIIILFLSGALCVGIVGFYFVYKVVADTEPVDKNKIVPQNSTQIFDRNGELITAEIGLEARENVRYEDLPQCVIDAFVSIEDSRYFVHNGFDLPRFIRAALENVKSFSFSQGGSTFTMQTIKFAYFMEEGEGGAAKSIERKIKEIYLSMQINDLISKKELFENYVNRINYGAKGRGIQVSSLYYFGKDVTELGISEAALLAGVVNQPYGFNPFWYLDDATFRRNEVLNMMAYHGYITPFECTAAKKIKVEDLLVGDDPDRDYQISPNQAYIDAVINEVIELTNEDPYKIPMKIYTAMDPMAQRVTEDVQNGKYSNAKVNAHKYLDNAIAVLNHDFEIIALGGGKNYFGQRMFNLATDMKKQAGSAVKPVIPYVLAYEYTGLTTGSYVFDGPMYYPGTSTQIWDWNNRYRGIISVNTALADSRNVPAVDTLQQVVNAVGKEKVIEYLNNVGFSNVNEDTFSVMDGIGGGNFATSPLEMAGAYNMLMNLGEYIKPHCVLRIEYIGIAKPAYEADYQRIQVISPEAAYLSAAVIERNVRNKVNNRYAVLARSHPVYAKSGTTDWGGTASRQLKLPVRNGSKDKWLMTSTTDYTIGVWVGYDKGVIGANTYLSSRLNNMNIPEHITKVILNALEKGHPKPGALKKPKGVGSATFIKGYTTHYAPIPGMPQQYITSGMNKAGTTALSTFVPPELGLISVDNISGLSNYNSYGVRYTQMNVRVPEFFNPDLLVVQPSKMRFKLGSKTYPGNRGNDVTWWMGPVRYYSQIENMSGQLVSPVFISETNNIFVEFNSSSYSSGTQMKACAYYAYSLLPDYRSGYDCKTFQIP